MTENTDPMRRALEFVQIAAKYPTAWIGHGMFAIQLVSELKPKVVVDLGVDYGFSTFCFNYPGVAEVYGIDSFEGDGHAGKKNTYPLVMGQMIAQTAVYKVPKINFIKGFFNEVAEAWPEGTKIDVLHIDGYHSYDAVREDFETWGKFLSDDGVVLFHDTISFKDDVGRFFNELPGEYKMNYEHSNGLGVWTRSEKTFEALTKIKNNYGTISL
jgi:hypothetical protein